MKLYYVEDSSSNSTKNDFVPFTKHIASHTSKTNVLIFVNNKFDPQFFFIHVYFYSLHVSDGDCGSSVVKLLCYKSEVLWFVPSWFNWKFLLI